MAHVAENDEFAFGFASNREILHIDGARDIQCLATVGSLYTQRRIGLACRRKTHAAGDGNERAKPWIRTQAALNDNLR